MAQLGRVAVGESFIAIWCGHEINFDIALQLVLADLAVCAEVDARLAGVHIEIGVLTACAITTNRCYARHIEITANASIYWAFAEVTEHGIQLNVTADLYGGVIKRADSG